MFTFTGCDSVQETIKDTKRKHSLFQKVIKDNNGLGSKVLDWKWEMVFLLRSLKTHIN